MYGLVVVWGVVFCEVCNDCVYKYVRVLVGWKRGCWLYDDDCG